MLYRYGFQGQEQDNEVKGQGNAVNYKYRMHDPRLGRFLSIDPLSKKYPHYTPYSFSGNKVIKFIELEGLEEAENRLDASFDKVPEGKMGEDWEYIEGKVYLNQENSKGLKPGNFFYSTVLGRRNGKERMYYRLLKDLQTDTDSDSNSNSDTDESESTQQVDGGGLNFISWTANPTSPASANATLAGVAALNNTNTDTGDPVSNTSPPTKSTERISPKVRKVTTTEVTTTVQTNVTTTNTITGITMDYATQGPFTPPGGGPGGMSSMDLVNNRLGFVRTGLGGMGILPGLINLGTTQWSAPPSATGGTLNRLTFNVSIRTTITTTVNTTVDTESSTETIYDAYTD
ncbi:MAG: RHS repeat-associated core domain-containing protein [Bacteroidota bacterium]